MEPVMRIFKNNILNVFANIILVLGCIVVIMLAKQQHRTIDNVATPTIDYDKK